MVLLILAVFYLSIAGCEVALADRCLDIFQRIVSHIEYLRLIGILSFVLALLYAISEPTRLHFLITLLFWVYLLSGILFLFGARYFVRLFRESLAKTPGSEKRVILYIDCAFRTIIGILLIYAM